MGNYLVTDTDLISVADAIRAKDGTSAQLAFPDGFVDAVGAIETGGGVDWDGLAAKTWPTGEAVFTGTSLLLSFNGFTEITKVTGKSITSLAASAFANCSKLRAIDLPALTSLGGASFQKAKIAGPLAFPHLVSIGGNSVFENNSLTAIDIGPNLTSNITGYMFSSNTSLGVVVLRKTSGVVGLASVTAFNNTPFASGRSGGTLYVPSALISSYQSATNWSTILGYTNNSIQAIEGSVYETQYADGTPIT